MTNLKERIQAQFPDGLTAIFAPDGTRTSWSTQIQRDKDDPGRIDDFNMYTDYGLNGALNIINWFFELGGSNAIFEVLDIHLLSGQREQYVEAAIQATHKILDSERVQYYNKYHVDPYFTGIDSLLKLPATHSGHKLALACQKFAETWDYQTSHYKIIYNIAPIPALSLGNKQANTETYGNLRAIAQDLYEKLVVPTYGTLIPPPVFYLGQARWGDIKLNGKLPIALDPTDDLRFFFTPYPSLYMKKETLITILNDLLRSTDMKLLTDKFDYRDRITPQMAQQLHMRFETLAANGELIGLSSW